MTEEGTRLTTSTRITRRTIIGLPVVQPAPAPPCDCPPDRCRFRLRLVRFYTHVARQAQILNEPLADVLRSEVKNSRPIDPWTRGGRGDPEACRDIALSLERARDVGGIDITKPWNAQAIAQFLCPDRCFEGSDR